MGLSPLAVALLATTVSQALATLAVFALPTLAAKAAADLGAAAHWLGLHVAIVYLHAAVVSASAAGVLRRLGPARCTQLALCVCAAGMALPAFGGLPGAALGAALIGAAYGLTNPAASEVLNRVAPPARRNLVFAVKQTGVPIGGVVAGLALPPLALAFGWPVALWLGAAACGLAAVLLWPLRAAWDQGRDAAAPLFAGRGRLLAGLGRGSALRQLAVVGALYAAVQVSFASYLVAMLVEEFGWNAVAAGAAAAAAQASGAVG
ncbi:MFS transporter, partial [Falsiroseomonas oryzae]|uniref:MFS transporter n=1 Tax=Falsiroseomonas oryzae TaxID=2766473 RepID=UPI0022EA4DA0